MRSLAALVTVVCFSSQAWTSTDPIDRLERSSSTPFRVSGKGVISDSGHPMHPGHSRAIDVVVRLEIDPVASLASIEVEWGEGETKGGRRYFVRQGRVFQVDDKSVEIAPEKLLDVSAAAVAALDPVLVASALRENRQNVRRDRESAYLFAANDVLWTVLTDKKTARIVSLTRREFHEVAGDGEEAIRFERSPSRVTVTKSGRETARLEFGPPEPLTAVAVPAGDERRERGHTLSPGEITFEEIAPHLLTIDLASLNTRVTVAEFADHVMVIEGAYDARIGDRLVQAILDRMGKPIRYHAFSHLHGQYIGSTRSFVAAGATILVPPTTAPMIEELAAAPHALQPDALSASPRKPTIATVKTERRLEAAMNAVQIFNVVSEHTDEYFIFWFPGPKILLTGDLMFYRPEKPLSGRSKRLCRTVAELGLAPDRYVATWPLDGYGTKNIVTGDEMRAACEAAP